MALDLLRTCKKELAYTYSQRCPKFRDEPLFFFLDGNFNFLLMEYRLTEETDIRGSNNYSFQIIFRISQFLCHNFTDSTLSTAKTDVVLSNRIDTHRFTPVLSNIFPQSDAPPLSGPYRSFCKDKRWYFLGVGGWFLPNRRGAFLLS